MTLPASHHPSSKTPAAWLTGGAALVLAGGVLAAGLLGPRFGLWGRGSAGRGPAPARVAVVEAGAGAAGESSSSAVGRDAWQPDGTAAGADRGGEPRRSTSGRAGHAAGADDRDGPGAPSHPDDLLAAWDRLEQRIAAAVARARESVVALEYTASDAPADTRRVATGVVINNRGEILSVRIDPPPTRPAPGTGRILAPIVARDFLGRRHAVRWVAADPETGLTLLRVSSRAMQAIPSAAHGPKLSCQVFVVGSPFGMGHSVSRGHVAGLDRAVELSTGQLGGLIQVQAPLYPGDSGAAVVNVRGHWLGLIRGGLAIPGSSPDTHTEPAATAGLASSRSDGVEPDDDRDTNFGFAIPTHDALWVADQLRAHGYVDRAYLGVRLESTAVPVVGPAVPASAPAAASTGTGDAEAVPAPTAAGDGARVRDVLAGTPAALAGLRPGDRIVALDGQAIRSHHDLLDRLDRIPARTTIILSILRGDGPQRPQIDLSLRTASRPGSTPVGLGPASSPTVTPTPRASVPVTPTASRAAPRAPVSAPAQPTSTPVTVSPTPDPVPAASPPSRRPAPEPPTTHPSPSDRPTRTTPTPAVSFHELRHTLPHGFVERMERLEQLESASTPATSPGVTFLRPTGSSRTP
jgi:serine protease Do